MTNKIKFFFIGFLLLFALTVSAAYIGGLLLPHASVISPHIVPLSSELPLIISTHSYPFGQGIITITIPVSDSVYQGAKLTNKEVTIYGNISEEVWVTDSYRSMVNDPAQEDLYRALIGETLQGCSSYGAFFNPSHFTTHEPLSGNPGAGLSGHPSHPAAMSATA